MTIRAGSKIPSVIIRSLEHGRLKNLDTAGFFENKKAVLFGLPGAFTPTCSTEHVPGYLRMLGKFSSLGIEIVCVSVNDAFVMKAWADSLKAEGINLLADGNCAFTKALGLEMDASNLGMGIRSKRYALYAENRIVRILAVEKPGEFRVSSAEYMYDAISDLLGHGKMA